MNLSRNTAALAVLTALALVGVVVLVAMQRTVPDVLQFVVVSGIGALAGVAVPSSVATRDASPLPDTATRRAGISNGSEHTP